MFKKITIITIPFIISGFSLFLPGPRSGSTIKRMSINDQQIADWLLLYQVWHFSCLQIIWDLNSGSRMEIECGFGSTALLNSLYSALLVLISPCPHLFPPSHLPLLYLALPHFSPLPWNLFLIIITWILVNLAFFVDYGTNW